MSLARILTIFNDSAAQCDKLISNAHRLDPSGAPLLPPMDQRQITVAAFLNLFLAWETFLERSLLYLMAGGHTLSGRHPIRYVQPRDEVAAHRMVVGVRPYFDFGNHGHFRTMVSIYFERGYPFEPHLTAIQGELSDLRTLRNASAHITSTTQAALEALAQRIFSVPQPGIDLYNVLLKELPGSAGQTVYAQKRDGLLAAAQLIANG